VSLGLRRRTQGGPEAALLDRGFAPLELRLRSPRFAMTDLYPDHPQYTRHAADNGAQFTPLNTDTQYPNHSDLPPPSTSSNTPSSPEGDSPVQETPKSDVGSGTPSSAANAAAQRPEGKQQATFLTKLYAYDDASKLATAPSLIACGVSFITVFWSDLRTIT
jgi:hypothetical protein